MAPPLRAEASALPPALSGELLRWASAAGGLACYRAGDGPPLLLLHSVNAAASAAEVRPLFDAFVARGRTVYAPDLPGFGHSERSDRVYTPRLMTDAVLAVVERIRSVHGTAPLSALAVSLGCEFLARAAMEQPGHFGPLALVSPTGFNRAEPFRGAPGSTRAVPGLHAVVSLPLWGSALFRALTRPGVVRYFLERTWGGKAIDEAAWAYAVATARVPGAQHAPLHFLGGGLFSADIGRVYEALVQPVWAVHGNRGDFVDYRGLAAFASRPNWRISALDGGALMFFEDLPRFLVAAGAAWPGGADQANAARR
jgi:pimeloyl-ACP methyl ester carboxylesterase